MAVIPTSCAHIVHTYLHNPPVQVPIREEYLYITLFTPRVPRCLPHPIPSSTPRRERKQRQHQAARETHGPDQPEHRSHHHQPGRVAGSHGEASALWLLDWQLTVYRDEFGGTDISYR
jgi:hypothetical protein